MLNPGDKAPAFTLMDENDQKVRLGDFKGRWVVLYFYPKDDTPGCTVQACEFTDALGELADLDAVVLGCSPDDAASHRKFIAKHKLKVKLLSDPTHETMQKYEAWGEKNMYGRKMVGVIRSTTLIDPSGKVAHRWKRVKAKGHADAVRKQLQSLRGA